MKYLSQNKKKVYFFKISSEKYLNKLLGHNKRDP